MMDLFMGSDTELSIHDIIILLQVSHASAFTPEPVSLLKDLWQSEASFFFAARVSMERFQDL